MSEREKMWQAIVSAKTDEERTAAMQAFAKRFRCLVYADKPNSFEANR